MAISAMLVQVLAPQVADRRVGAHVGLKIRKKHADDSNDSSEPHQPSQVQSHDSVMHGAEEQKSNDPPPAAESRDTQPSTNSEKTVSHADPRSARSVAAALGLGGAETRHQSGHKARDASTVTADSTSVQSADSAIKDAAPAPMAKGAWGISSGGPSSGSNVANVPPSGVTSFPPLPKAAAGAPALVKVKSTPASGATSSVAKTSAVKSKVNPAAATATSRVGTNGVAATAEGADSQAMKSECTRRSQRSHDL